MRNWNNQKFLLCKLDYSAISRYFFTNFSNHKTNLRDFSSFISLVVGLFCFKSQWKLFILKAVHASIRPFFSLFKYFCADPFQPQIFRWSDSNSQNFDWDIMERFPVSHYETFIFHAQFSMETSNMFISTIKCEIL